MGDDNDNKQFDPDNVDTTKKSKLSKKFIAIATSVVSLLVIVTGTLVIIPSNDTDSGNVDVNEPQNFQQALNLKTKKQLDQEKQKQAAELAKKQSQEQQKIRELTSQIDKLKGNEQVVQELKEIINGLNQQVQAINTRIMSIENATLDKDHKNQNQQRQIQARLQELHQSIARLSSNKQRNDHPNANEKPPFDLISVDIWGNNPEATIRYEGKFSLVKVGDTRLHWKIIDLSFDKETAQVQNLINNKKVLIFKVK